MDSNQQFVHHPIHYRCPTCGSVPGERCVNILGAGPKDLGKKYHNTREAVARNAKPINRFSRMRKRGVTSEESA